MNMHAYMQLRISKCDVLSFPFCTENGMKQTPGHHQISDKAVTDKESE